MEEKILIKSEINKRLKNVLQKGPLILLGIAALIRLMLTKTVYVSSYSDFKRTAWNCVFDFDEYTKYFIWFVIGALCLLTAIILAIIYAVHRKCELQITENNVKGKTLFGKEVVLPLYMVSAYSTRKFLSVVAIATSSGITKFSLIGNYKEICAVLAQKINQRQENTVQTTTTQNNSMDDIVKLKSLLDAGIITQEEFDTKKKQLLGL